jgi:hypothetical protein
MALARFLLLGKLEERKEEPKERSLAGYPSVPPSRVVKLESERKKAE